MATTTPHYGWPVPTSTDYVKDGATAIEALGDAIDATVFGLPSGSLTLVKSQTIGTAVSSVAVTGAFSATYNAYKIIITGGVSSAECDVTFQLGSTTTGYYYAITGTNYSGSGARNAGQSNDNKFGYAGKAFTTGIDFNVEVSSPFLAKRTFYNSRFIEGNTGWLGEGYLADTTSYTGFTIGSAGGNTLTGGEIRVYGYAL